MKIYVARHGFAGDYSRDPAVEQARPLQEQGQRDVSMVAAALKAAGEEPTVIYASPFVRALQTAYILGNVLGCRVTTEDQLQPDRDLVPFVEELLDDDEMKRVMLVGHVDNLVPMLEDLGDGKVDALRKGEVRKFDFDRGDGSWEELSRWLPESGASKT